MPSAEPAFACPLPTADQSYTLHSTRYGQSYHSTFGALTEARHVYVRSSGLEQRLQAGQPSTVLEIGFGLGLNALLSLDLAEHLGTPLHFHSVEHALLPVSLLQRMDYRRWLYQPTLADELLHALARLEASGQLASSARPVNASDPASALDSEHAGKAHRIALGTHTDLILHLADASCVPWHPLKAHAIYLDAFSPDKNPECWNTPFLTHLSASLLPGARLSTFCARGAVRRALHSCGLRVHRLAGPPGKREILFAEQPAR